MESHYFLLEGEVEPCFSIGRTFRFSFNALEMKSEDQNFETLLEARLSNCIATCVQDY